MKAIKALVLGITLVCLGSSSPCFATEHETAATQGSCRDFVASFYHWYIPKAFSNNGDEVKLALTQKRSSFGEELYHGLSEDAEAQAKSPGELVGLDFDPFLGGQDLRDRYLFGAAMLDGDTCRVRVYGISSGKRNSKPDVIPELVFRNNEWVFVNFRYHQSDLLGVLKNLKELRQRHASEPRS